MGASPAVRIASSTRKHRQAVGGRAFRGYAIAPVLCSIPRWNTVRSSRCSPLHYANHQAPPIPCAFPAVKPLREGKSFLRSEAFTLAFTDGKAFLALPSQPLEEFRTPPKPLSCVRQCSAATIPLRPRFVPLCGLRYINASGIAAPNPAGLIGVLHIVFIPCQHTSLSCWQ